MKNWVYVFGELCDILHMTTLSCSPSTGPHILWGFFYMYSDEFLSNSAAYCLYILSNRGVKVTP